MLFKLIKITAIVWVVWVAGVYIRDNLIAAVRPG